MGVDGGWDEWFPSLEYADKTVAELRQDKIGVCLYLQFGVNAIAKVTRYFMASKAQRKKNRATGRSGSDKKPAESRRGRLRREFNPDYSHVKKDLRRIGILTGTLVSNNQS